MLFGVFLAVEDLVSPDWTPLWSRVRSQVTLTRSMEVEVSAHCPKASSVTYGCADLWLGFGMSSDQSSLLGGDCTSCAVTQDKSAYWAPALYFMHTNGSAQVVDEVGGMLA
jgi:hypothetical protein